MNIKETRAALKRLQVPCTPVPQQHWDQVMKLADAYGDARELKGHVETCGKLEARPTEGGGDGRYHHCGDGWLCAVAEELGK